MAQELRVEQYVELVIFPASRDDDFDPDELTEVLGISPSSTYRKGLALENGTRRAFTSWHWYTAERVESDCERLIQEALETFEPVADRLAEAMARWRLYPQIGLVGTMYGFMEDAPDGSRGAVVSTPSMHLSPETLQRLANLGCGLDFDQFVVIDE